MNENINIDDSTITSALTFRNLVLMNMQQLTNFPYIEKDFDALTDYELLCLVVKYLNDVIENQNKQNASITNMYNAFLSLQDYVNNTKDDLVTAFNDLNDYVRDYFENLDVQDEINNKLNSMAQSGELTLLIKNYIDPLQNAFEDEITSRINNQDVLINQIANKVNSAVTGEVLFVSNISQMVDTSKIYVLTTDSNWYYYNGSEWIVGGSYPSTILNPESVKYFNLNNDVVGNEYHFLGTVSLPSIIFELDNTYAGTTSEPIQVKLRFKAKGISNTTGYVMFTGYNLNQEEHTISDNYNTSLSPEIMRDLYNYVEIEKTINYTHNMNGFGVGVNQSTNQEYDFYIKDLEIYINDEKVNYTFDSSYTMNSNVTFGDNNMTYLSDKDYVDEKIKEPILSYNRFSNKILNNLYVYDGNNASGQFPQILFLLPKFYRSGSVINIKYKLNVYNYFRSVPILNLYGVYNTHTNILSSSWTSSTDKNLLNNFGEVIDTNIVTTHDYNVVGFRLNLNSPLEYNFSLEDYIITIDGLEVSDFDFIQSLSTNFTNKTSSIDKLITNKEVNELVFDNKTIEYYDSITKSNKYEISCWGDSLTQGGTAEGIPYPRILNNLLGDKYNVKNFGVGGQRSGAIAFRSGAVKWYVTTGFSIPASNSESISFPITIETGNVINIANNIVFDVTINGIDGKLTTSSTDYKANTIQGSFKRNTSGSIVNVNANTEIKSVQDGHTNDLTIIWMGLNDITFAYPYQSIGPFNNSIAMINHLTAKVKRFLIISSTTTSGMVSQTQLKQQTDLLNSYYAKYYPNNYIDLNSYAVNQLIYDMGITPTEEDIECMNAGCIPRSVTGGDGIHFSGAAREYTTKYIYDELAMRGWI